MPGSVSGHVHQFPLDQFVVFGSFGREQLKIVDCEEVAGRHGSIFTRPQWETALRERTRAKLEPAGMTETQLYIAAGLPTVAVLVGILMNVSLFNSLSARLLALENKVDTKLYLVAGKLAELDNRLSRVEERLSIH
jgi:hypothetical protein